MTWPSKMNTRWTVWFSVKDGFEDLSLQGYLHFHVANPTLPWHRLFRVMEEVNLLNSNKIRFQKNLLQAKTEVGEGLEYSVSQTTLEQVKKLPPLPLRDALEKKLRYYLGIFPKWRIWPNFEFWFVLQSCVLEGWSLQVFSFVFDNGLYFQVFLSFAKKQKGEASWVCRLQLGKLARSSKRAPMYLIKSKN